MSENIRGITFAEQVITPADDAIVRRTVLGNGILSGCEISYSGSTLTMAAGYMIVCGRSFQITTAQNWAVVDSTSGVARLVLTIDLTKTATENAFHQIDFAIEYASTQDGFADLVQENINVSGTKYQLVVAVVSLGTGGITGVIFKMEKTAVNPYNYAQNSDFTQFVAQAGIGGKHGTQAYAGDRWILDSGTVTGDARDDGNGYTNITLNGTIRQIVENAPDVGTTAIEMVSGTADISYANGAITITSNGGTIRNVRLFKGNWNADNMAAYQPKGYSAELMECLRYYKDLTNYIATVLPYAGGSSGIISIDTDVEMRVKPTLSISRVTFLYGGGASSTPTIEEIVEYNTSPGKRNYRLNFGSALSEMNLHTGFMLFKGALDADFPED